MKCIWEEEDINAGQRYAKNEKTEVLIIGYLSLKPGQQSEEDEKAERHTVGISTVDGMVTCLSTKQELAQILTEGKYLPIEWINRPRRNC